MTALPSGNIFGTGDAGLDEGRPPMLRAPAAVASSSARRLAVLLRDPRHYQIGALSLLLLYGMARLHLEIRLSNVTAFVVAAIAVQAICTAVWGLPRFDPRSALISSLSLSLLLRTNHIELAALAAAITISSKFLIRRGRKHIFNPTNFGLVAMMLLTPEVWVSPAQWGTASFFAFLLICVGGLVVYRAERSDVTYAFLAFYGAMLAGRALWLGDPISIPLHQVQSGAFLIFTFFMISDPRTTPDSRAGRILFAFLVASGAVFVRFGLYRTNGLLWCLATFALLVPIIDRFLPGRRHEWPRETSSRMHAHQSIQSTVSGGLT